MYVCAPTYIYICALCSPEMTYSQSLIYRSKYLSLCSLSCLSLATFSRAYVCARNWLYFGSMKHTMYISYAYIFSCTLHRDCVPKYCAIFSALLRTCFFYCQNKAAMYALFAHCLFMYRNVRFLTEYDLIWIFFTNIFDILLARGCAHDRLSHPRASLFPPSCSHPLLRFSL